MAVNLSRHRTELLQAYDDILNERNGKNWMILSYEPSSSALTLLSSGAGGLEEMALSFDCCKVQYGLCSLRDSASSLTKVVLIQWQGESAPFHLLGPCGAHVREVERFFKGIHLTHYARNEEDIDPDAIRKALFKVTSGFGIDHSSPFVKPEPVGSVYRPVQAKTVIDLSERQKFWAQAEKEEAERRAAEHLRMKQNIASIEKEKQRLEERLRKECEERIGKVKIGSEALSAINGALNSDATPKIPAANVAQPSKFPSHVNESLDSRTANEVEEEMKATIQTECNGDAPNVEDSLTAVALWDYQAADDSEISFLPGDTITNIEKVDPGWWYGTGPDKSNGLFPANYVKLLED